MKRLSRVLLKMLAASAGLTLLFASAAMAQEVVKDQDHGKPADAFVGVDGYMTQAQTITTETGGVLHHAYFNLTPEGENPGPLCADLWSVSNDTPVELQQPLGCVDASEIPFRAPAQWVKIDFQSTPYLQPGDKYAIILRNDAILNQGYRWGYTQDEGSCSQDLYTGGTAFSGLYNSYPMVEWNRAECVDFQFIVYNTVDATAPTGTVLINNGATRTTERLVTLNLSASDPDPSRGGLQMRFKNGGTDTSWSAWKPYKSSRSWYLTPGEGTKRVAAQFRDAAGNRSAPVYDYIVFKR
jgi:hypothetical protein